MEEIKSFIFYKSFYEAIKSVPGKEQLKLYNAICEYCFTESTPQLGNGVAKAMFTIMQPIIDSANSRYRTSVENGKRGGAPKGNKNALKQPRNNLETTQKQPRNNLSETQEQPKNNLNDNYNDNVNANNNVNGNADFKEAWSEYQNNISISPSPFEYESIQKWYDTFKDKAVIIKAIHEAAANNARSLKYVEAVLMNWDKQGLKTYEDVERYLNNRKISKGKDQPAKKNTGMYEFEDDLSDLFGGEK